MHVLWPFLNNGGCSVVLLMDTCTYPPIGETLPLIHNSTPTTIKGSRPVYFVSQGRIAGASFYSRSSFLSSCCCGCPSIGNVPLPFTPHPWVMLPVTSALATGQRKKGMNARITRTEREEMGEQDPIWTRLDRSNPCSIVLSSSVPVLS